MTVSRTALVVTASLLSLLIVAFLTLWGCESQSSVGYGVYRSGAEYDTREAPACPDRSPEVWVIARDSNHSTETRQRAGLLARVPESDTSNDANGEAYISDDDLPYPESGRLYAMRPDQSRHVPMPLKHTSVNASIHTYIATVAVDQQFENPFSVKIEATYVFPLPDNAAINEFVMTIGHRHIRGIIRERKEAERIYEQAKAQGYRASLLTQQRPNVFAQKVANIDPGKQIDIHIRYFQTLAYDDGWYEWVFPMVVGPRYNPLDYSEGIDATSRGSSSPTQPTNVNYLRPGERSDHDISLTLDLDAGVGIEESQSINHRIHVSRFSDAHQKITLASDANNIVANKDFVFRWRVAGEQIKTNLLTYRASGDDGYFTLMLYPPRQIDRLSRAPMEMIFVIDCSGSMNGKPIEQAKAAVIEGLKSLEPGDTFQIVRFSDKASSFGREPVRASSRNIEQAVRYVRQLNGGGGTEMLSGIKSALDFPHDPDRLRYVTFLTDGYIGNDREIIGEVAKRIGDARLFSFGVGSSPNRFLLDRMAKLGRGTVAYLSLNDSGADVMDNFFHRVSHPALTDLDIDWRSARVDDMFPSELPDLFVGRPVVITGRYTGSMPARITVHGRVDGRRVDMIVPLDDDPDATNCIALPSVWARMKIADLHEQADWSERRSTRNEIRDVALRYGLMSAYTSFIAVDASQHTDGDFGVTVPVSVPVPDGVRYDTTVRE